MNTKGNDKRRTRWFAPSVALLVMATLALAFSMAVTAAGGKSPAKSTGRSLTDQELQNVVDQTHAQNVRFLEQFEARGGDARTLQVIKISSWRTLPLSLGAAAAQAQVIVHGNVAAVHFIANPSGGMPQMTALVNVGQVGKGSLASPSIVVRQAGGPVSQPNGRGALVRLDGEELILPGDEVVLLLTRLDVPLPEYRAVYGAGIQFIRNGKMSGETAERYGLVSQNFADLWKALTDPQLAAVAFPLRGSAD